MAPELFDRIESQNADAETDFAALVVQVANGKEIDAAEAMQILEFARKSERDLSEAVVKCRKVREDKLLAATLPVITAESEAIDQEILDMNRELAEAKETYRIKCGEVLERQANVVTRHREAFAAQQRILASRDDLEILGAERLLDDERTALLKERAAIESRLAPSGGIMTKLHNLKNQSARTKQSAKSYSGVFGWLSPKISADAARQELDAFERDYVTPLRQRIVAINARVNEINREMAVVAKQKLEVRV